MGAGAVAAKLCHTLKNRVASIRLGGEMQSGVVALVLQIAPTPRFKILEVSFHARDV